MNKKIKLSKSEIISRHAEEWTDYSDFIVHNGQGIHIKTSRLGSKYVFVWILTYDNYNTEPPIAVYNGYENTWQTRRSKYVTLAD